MPSASRTILTLGRDATRSYQAASPGIAEVSIVFAEEAHARADGNKRLNGFADQVQAMDADRLLIAAGSRRRGERATVAR